MISITEIMLKQKDINNAVAIVKQGGIIAYPTEAVFGLGCDPFNENTVLRLLKLKQRSIDKGLILIAAKWQDVKNLSQPLAHNILQKAFATWPGHITWVFPATKLVPAWIRGAHKSVALRITNHPIAQKICEAYGGPIVSTSANIEGQTPAHTTDEVLQYFPHELDYIVPGNVGKSQQPTKICDILTGKVLR
jgi:L-threonylcarbamoyladenylate synthase